MRYVTLPLVEGLGSGSRKKLNILLGKVANSVSQTKVLIHWKVFQVVQFFLSTGYLQCSGQIISSHICA